MTSALFGRLGVRIGIQLVVAAIVAGCLAQEPLPATPTPTAPSIAPAVTLPPRGSDELVIGLSAEPVSLLPTASDEGSRLVTSLVHEGLYRLDASLRPQPILAAGPPVASADGLTWRIELRGGIRFQDGSALTARDAAFTLELATSPGCPFAAAVCDAARADIESAVAESETALAITLLRPSAPLLATVLADLPVLPQVTLTASLARFDAATGGIDPAVPRALIDRIASQLNDDQCLVRSPPPSCLLSTAIPELESLLATGGLALPERARFEEPGIGLDAEAYATALLEAAQRLATALEAEGTDRLAAALPLLDAAANPVGAGPFAFAARTPGTRLELVRNDAYPAGAPPIGRIRIEVIPDPGIAATALRSGDVDWLPTVSPDQVPDLEGHPGVAMDAHADGRLRAIVFNVRAGRVFDERPARQAFALCIAKEAAAAEPTGGRALLAWTPLPPDSWAADPDPARLEGDPSRARGLLEAAGWASGPDGIYRRGDQRLAATIHVRPSRPDLLGFVRGIAEQLRGCGIELTVEELDLSGEVLLEQVQHPNDFEATLVSRTLGLDPDTDLAAFASDRITTEANPADANFGGWASAAADRLIEAGRATLDETTRRAAYLELQRILGRELPIYPIWYEAAWSALSTRVVGPAGPIDLSRPGYARDVARWQVKNP